MQGIPINLWAVLIAAAINNAIGGLWYSSLLFGEAWRKALGKTKEELREMQQTGGRAIGLNGLAILLLTYILAHFIYFVEATTAIEGMTAAFWVWLGFIATTDFAGVVFEKRPLKLYIIYNAYQLVALLATGALLASWH
jgi:hypothetical protein